MQSPIECLPKVDESKRHRQSSVHRRWMYQNAIANRVSTAGGCIEMAEKKSPKTD
jgi:hypothetical protein